MIGKQRHTIDAKNRIFLPAKFREELGTHLVLSQSITGKCIRVYSKANWQKFEEKINALPEIELDDGLFWLFANAEQVDVDAQGRIAIPQELRQYAELGKDIVSVGRGERMEIWNEAEFEARQKSVDLDKLRDALIKRGF